MDSKYSEPVLVLLDALHHYLEDEGPGDHQVACQCHLLAPLELGLEAVVDVHAEELDELLEHGGVE